jgi:hypothetical protein
MNFAAMKARIGRGILRDDLAPYYGDYIDDALQDIQNRHSFPCMKTSVNVTIPLGTLESTVNLPANFKELQSGTPIYFITPEGRFIPGRVEAESRQVAQQWFMRRWIVFNLPLISPFSIFFERYGLTPPSGITPTPDAAAGVTAVVGMVTNPYQPMPLRVDYFGYLPKLVNDTDVSPLVSAYPEMVLAKAKAIAFDVINDNEAFDTNMKIYEGQLNTAIRQDAYSEVAGRTLRM